MQESVRLSEAKIQLMTLLFRSHTVEALQSILSLTFQHKRTAQDLFRQSMSIHYPRSLHEYMNKCRSHYLLPTPQTLF